MSFCVDVDALQRMSGSVAADADLLKAADVTATTNLAAAALPGSATAAAVAALAGPIHTAYGDVALRLRDVAAGIEHHVRTCVESDLAFAQR